MTKDSVLSKQINLYLEKHGFEALKPKAVLFDMDGVIYDSMPFHAIAWQKAMERYGINMTAEDAYATEGARGIDTIKIMMMKQRGIDLSDEMAQRMYDLKTKFFHEFPKTDIFPGVKELMAKIKENGGKICVVTGSGQRPLIERLLSDFGEYLDREHIVSAYDVERGKPYPDPYLKGMVTCGIKKRNEVLVIENAPLGIQSGVSAGIFTIAVNSGPLKDKVLWKAGADIVVRSMLDVCNIWDEIQNKEKPKSRSQVDRWNTMLDEIVSFIEKNKRNPSKHYVEELRKFNWIKHNKKLLSAGKMLEERIEPFKNLLRLMLENRHVNQYSYLNRDTGECFIFE